MRMPACFLLGKQKAHLQLIDIFIVTLHWQDRPHQQFFWKSRTRGSNVLPPSRSPHPSPPCERSSFFEHKARVSQCCSAGGYKASFVVALSGFQCPRPCSTSPLLQPFLPEQLQVLCTSAHVSLLWRQQPVTCCFTCSAA